MPALEAATTEVAPPVVPLGSVQEAALAHPLVQRAQEIFKAEVRSVLGEGSEFEIALPAGDSLPAARARR